MTERNPFTPAFGTTPAILAGRDELLHEMREALVQGTGDPNLSSILVGPRGTGKTVCLSRIAEDAEACGWIAASSSAIPGLLEDLFEQTLREASHLVDPHGGVRITNVGVGPLSAGWEYGAERRGNWRTRMGALLDQLAEHGTGLLLTVDEVDASLDELITLASVYQHLVREDRKVALVMAGLPSHVGALLSNRSVSFLRRAQRHTLGRVSDADVADAFRRTMALTSKSLDAEALDACTTATEGFPYMLQLVGFRSWQAAQDKERVGPDDARAGVDNARRDFEEHVLAPSYRELSPMDVSFVNAMLQDKVESRLSDIAQRMGVTSRYASTYRSRLQEAGVVESPARGIVRFCLPGFPAYARHRMELG